VGERIWTVEDHLAGHPASSVALYERFVDLAARCGPFSYAVSTASITFKGSRRGFAGARPDLRGLRGYLDLQRTVEDPRILSAARYTNRLFVHHYRVTDLAELDDVFADWVHEAYAAGNGEHLRPRP
jgi:hypothetical protein